MIYVLHRTRENTGYTVLTHIGVWVKTKINMDMFCLGIDYDNVGTKFRNNVSRKGATSGGKARHKTKPSLLHFAIVQRCQDSQ